MADDAASFVGEVPRHYDTGMGPVIFQPYAELMAEQVAGAAPRRVLETAAGTGIVSRALERALPDADLVVTDLNGPMLEVARGRVRGRVEVADAQSLPYDDDSFDAVVCQFGLMFLPDRAAGLREARRVLAPGGTFWFSTWDDHGHNPYARIADALIRLEYPQDTPRFYAVPFSLSSVDRLREELEQAGFAGLRVDYLPREVPCGSWDDFARGFTRGNPVAAQISARGGDPEVFQDRLARAYEAEFGAAPATMPVQAILVAATAP